MGTESRDKTIMSTETDDERAIQIEDDLRCRECGSTEAGNCFYCKMD